MRNLYNTLQNTLQDFYNRELAQVYASSAGSVKLKPLIDYKRGILTSDLIINLARELRRPVDELSTLAIAALEELPNIKVKTEQGFLNFDFDVSSSMIAVEPPMPKAMGSQQLNIIITLTDSAATQPWQKLRSAAAAIQQAVFAALYGIKTGVYIWQDDKLFKIRAESAPLQFKEVILFLSDGRLKGESISSELFDKHFNEYPLFIWGSRQGTLSVARSIRSLWTKRCSNSIYLRQLEQSYLSFIESDITFKQLIEWDSSSLFSLMFYLAGDTAGAELDPYVAKLNEPDNQLWFLKTILKRIEFMHEANSCLANSLNLIEAASICQEGGARALSNEEQQLLSRINFLSHFAFWAAYDGEVFEFQRALLDLVYRLNRYFNAPDFRSELSRELADPIKCVIISRAFLTLSGFTSRIIG